MPDDEVRFDRQSVAEQWDYAAEAYDEFQASGNDFYRLELFGPAHVAMCGEVRGLRVLDLGCGNGYFCRAMAHRGASVVGIDLSAKQIEYARRHEVVPPQGIEYVQLDAALVGEHLEPESFDLVTSCMALQDMPEPEAVILGAFQVLRGGGRLVASIAHPFSDLPHREWERKADGTKGALKLDRYFDRGPVEYAWPAARMLYAWRSVSIHVTLSDWFRWFLSAGFLLRGLEEPYPDEELVARRPEMEDCARLPYFLLLDFLKT
jgi:2-polyprenyl-3-methyl-5-hydroxy-6-metoxy-1,4-benzoquinol methylase